MLIEELHKKFLEKQLISTDTRQIEKGAIFFALKGDSFNGNKFANQALSKGAALAIIDEKKYVENEKTILVKNVLETLQELATFHRKKMKAKVIAITGTNGKTTTKELIYAVLQTEFSTIATKGNLNNHIGVPLNLLRIKKNTQFAIIEMGANHLKEIASLCEIAQPDFGIITNIGKAHLEGFGNYEGVIKAKTEMYEYLAKNNGIVFYNADNSILKNYISGINSIAYAVKSVVTYRGELLRANPFVKMRFWSSPKLRSGIKIHSKLIGTYNLENILAALAIGSYFGIDKLKLKAAIEEYQPDNNRSQFLTTATNSLVLDAYNANPTSMTAAINNFAQIDAERKTLILGDMLELGEFSLQEHNSIIQRIEELEFQQVFLVGVNFHTVIQQNTNNIFQSFCSVADLNKYLETNPLKQHTVLLKGSRGIELEQVIPYL